MNTPSLRTLRRSLRLHALGASRRKIASHLASRLDELTRPTGMEEELAVAFPEPGELRFSIPPRVAALVAAVTGIVVTIVILWQVVSQAQNQQSPQLGAPVWDTTLSPPATASHAMPTSAAADVQVVVSVVGEVHNPGLHSFPPTTARIADALTVAGVKPEGDIRGLNLAEKLVDGTQIVVPHRDHHMPDQPSALLDARLGGALVMGPATTPGSGVEGMARVNLNHATETELLTLPGVGEKTAQAIIQHRESIGGFSAIEQLQDVKGIGPAKFAQIKPAVTL
ncbi:MAG: helix-hairpin-helix domain-containing protein [Corynebacterium sp.]|uniref:helix-hairpin-helix domain-containing protein n=1 Tax=Corynebacterium sp. TaxID=1720 RepID=UPI0026DD22E8|nr:helix-hairpin-helix domain-containing protein [Corynebacterium sp.]MDO4761397.1 helix-hairpin-helix domain-containing protein [Corynebacterium sp.]